MAWSGTPVAASASIPLMAADGVTAVNTAANYRQGFIGSLIAPAPGGPMSWRSGIMPTTWASGATQHADGRVDPVTPTNNNQVKVQPFNAVINRSGTNAGPYLVNFPTVSTLTTDPGDPSNPRYDLICVKLVDQAIDGAGSQQGGYLYIINGTPAGSPTRPPVPAGSIKLAELLRTANTTIVTSAMITNTQNSAGTYGGVRPLLPGDSLTDPGSYAGEITVRTDGLTTGIMRFWDPSQQKWRGINTPPPYQASAPAAASGQTGSPTVLSVTIPDPGYPYYVTASGQLAWSQGINCIYYLNTYFNSVSGTMIGSGQGYNNTTGSVQSYVGTTLPSTSAAVTGASTVALVLYRDPASTNPGSGVGWSGGVAYNRLNVTISPA